jgi:spore coat protein A
MLIAPGERKDIVLDFSGPALWGQTIIVTNNAKTPYPKGDAVNPQTTGRIMAFRVNKPLNTNYPFTTLPTVLRAPITPLQSTLPPRKLILFEAKDEFGRLKPMLGTVENGVLEWHDAITENPMLNSTEIWEIYNETMDAHPIHLHQVSMQLLNRQKFNASVDLENGKPAGIRLLGQPKTPTPDEQGWKDTWVMYPGEVTRVIATFDNEGLYVWHCHILSHEDHEMMRPFYVGEMNNQMSRLSAVKNATPALEQQLQLQTIPNPFSNQFSIKFALPQSSMVTVNIYDAKGSILKKIYSGVLGHGLQQLKVEGIHWAAGIYYCEVISNNERIIRKMILQK